MSIDLAQVESGRAIMMERGLLSYVGGPSDGAHMGRPLIPLYLGDFADVVGERVKGRRGVETTPIFIAGIESLREFVKQAGDEVSWLVVEGDEEMTDHQIFFPDEFLAGLPAGTHYGFEHHPSEDSKELFNPGEVSITPGVYEALGTDVGEVVQELLHRHLGGDSGSVESDSVEMNCREIASTPEPYVMSVYSAAGVTVWIISQYGKTYVMLPSEY